MKDEVAPITLAVMPFQNLSDNNELAYFAEGFVEDIITDLSRFNSLHIISYHSTKTIKDAGAEQEFITSNHIQYLVKGSFRYQNQQVRISTQLIRTGDGSILWAERYDEALEQIFQIQNDIAQRIVNTLSKQIDLSLLSSARKKPVTSLPAYDCWLRGMEQLKYGTLAHDEEARKFFRQALEKDPHFARAYTGLSLSYFNEWSCQLWHKWEENEEGAFTYAEKAAQLDQTDHLVQLVLARVLLYRRQFERAEQHINQALTLNPNDADSLVQLATCLAYLGKTAESEEWYLKALRLNPHRDPWYYAYGAFIYFAKGAYKKSIELAEKAPSHSIWVDFTAQRAACYALDQQVEQAKQQWNIFLKTFQEKILYGRSPEPGEAIRWLIKVNPFKDAELIPEFAGQMKNLGILDDDYAYMPASEDAISSFKAHTFKKEKELWEMTFEGHTVFLPELKGFNDIALLLSQSMQEIHCTALMDVPISSINEEFMLDEKAKKSYHQRITDLQEDIDEADQMHDAARAQSLREEMDQIIEHLSKATDIYGRSRKLGSPAERARTAVTWRIRNAIKKIENAHPGLGMHLSHSIRTGTFCSYSPEKPKEWVV